VAQIWIGADKTYAPTTEGCRGLHDKSLALVLGWFAETAGKVLLDAGS